MLNEAIHQAIESYDRSAAMRLYVHQVLFKETIWAQVCPFYMINTLHLILI